MALIFLLALPSSAGAMSCGEALTTVGKLFLQGLKNDVAIYKRWLNNFGTTRSTPKSIEENIPLEDSKPITSAPRKFSIKRDLVFGSISSLLPLASFIRFHFKNGRFKIFSADNVALFRLHIATCLFFYMMMFKVHPVQLATSYRDYLQSLPHQEMVSSERIFASVPEFFKDKSVIVLVDENFNDHHEGAAFVDRTNIPTLAKSHGAKSVEVLSIKNASEMSAITRYPDHTKIFLFHGYNGRLVINHYLIEPSKTFPAGSLGTAPTIFLSCNLGNCEATAVVNNEEWINIGQIGYQPSETPSDQRIAVSTRIVTTNMIKVSPTDSNIRYQPPKQTPPRDYDFLNTYLGIRTLEGIKTLIDVGHLTEEDRALKFPLTTTPPAIRIFDARKNSIETRPLPDLDYRYKKP